MVNINNSLSRFKRNAKNKITNVKNKVQNIGQKFKENFSEAKSKPRSKPKSLLLGFSTVLGIFGVTLFTSVLPAVAKDLTNKGSKPAEICPAPRTPSTPAQSQQIVNALSGGAATICALAITSGSFLVGAACGVIVVVGVLKAQGK